MTFLYSCVSRSRGFYAVLTVTAHTSKSRYRKEVNHVDRSYRIQILQIKEAMGTITKEESDLLKALLQAEYQSLDSWVDNHYYYQ